MPKPPLWWSSLDNSQLVRFLLMVAVGWAVLQILNYFELILAIFSFAGILAFLLSYPARWLSRSMPYMVAVYGVMAGTLVVMGGLLLGIGLTVLTQAPQVTLSVADFLTSVVGFIQQGERNLSALNIEINLEDLEQQLRGQVLSWVGSGVLTLGSLLGGLLQLLLIVVIAFFILLDGKRLWALCLKPFPPHWRKPITVAVRRNFLGFFWGRFLLSVFFAASSFIVFLLLGTPSALTLALIAGFFDLIPGIGATLGVGLIALLLLPQSVWMSLQVMVICITLQQVEENILLPRIMKGSLNINPVVMFLALFVGLTVAGLLGVFLAIPITGVLISLLDLDEMRATPEWNSVDRDPVISSKLPR
jgi:predicted PurR-regulated permease PerM